MIKKNLMACDCDSNISSYFIIQALLKGERKKINSTIQYLHQLFKKKNFLSGTRLTENLRDHFSKPIVNSVVWPYQSGEVLVQHYNSALTMAHLQEVCLKDLSLI